MLHYYSYNYKRMNNSAVIWMLEKDLDDRFITETTLAELGHRVNLTYFSYSNELLETLKTSDKPSLILLDYNSIPQNGVEILHYLKGEDNYKSIPVVILGDTSSSRYISQCYSSGASAFIQKPTTIELTNQKIDLFFKYWLEVVEL